MGERRAAPDIGAARYIHSDRNLVMFYFIMLSKRDMLLAKHLFLEQVNLYYHKIRSYDKMVKASREMGARYMTFEEYIKEEREEAREEGREEGRAEGRSEGELLKTIFLIRKKLQRGKSLQETARELEEEVTVLKPIYDCILQNPDKDDKYILEQCQKQDLGKSS